MITGYNTDIKHNDRVFHIQTEDKGIDNPIIESLIYMGGKIVASRQYCYATLLREGYSEKVVQDMLDGQHRKMMRDIRGGKYDPEGPPPFGAGIITERTFDEVVLEFIRSQAGSEKLELVINEAPSPRAGEPLVIDLLVRTDVRNAPIPAARVSITAISADGDRSVSLFEGASDAEGRVKAGVEPPRELAGGRLVIEAHGEGGPVAGQDQATLEIAGT